MSCACPKMRTLLAGVGGMEDQVVRLLASPCRPGFSGVPISGLVLVL